MEKYHYIVNVEAAIFKDDKWLVTQRSEQEPHAPGTLSMPGGKVEVSGHANDVLEEAVKREVMEEVGVELDVLDYVKSSAFVTDDSRQAVDIPALEFTAQHSTVFFCSKDGLNLDFKTTADRVRKWSKSPKKSTPGSASA